MSKEQFSPVQQEIVEMKHVGLTDGEIAKHLQMTSAQLSALWDKLTHSLKDISRHAAVDAVLAQMILAARAALADKQDEMAMIVSASDAKAVITFNVWGIITGVSHEGERLLGQSCEALVGKSIDSVLKGKAHGSEQSGDEMARAGEGETVSAVRVHRRADGSVFEGEHTVIAIVGDTGHVTGFIREVRDLTDRRVHEMELQEIKATLAILVREP